MAQLQESIGKKNARIDGLVKSNDDLLVKIDQYQKTVTEKDQKIEELKAEVGKLSLTSPKLLPDGRIAASKGVSYLSEYSEAAGNVRNLFNDGKYDEAYAIAEGLMKKIPDFGLAYFLMGTIDIQRGNMPEGESFLLKSIQLELTNRDKAWAFHNLGIAALRQQNIGKAIDYLKKAIEINPDMEESKKTLSSIEKQMGND
ncbi:tetratricopeptide repeat protein [Candidatus Kuenenia stuttgartensis]|uniref:tetratricopeptide repeat protein n=1 Tax=Kuenenia stuttgartiensis TaxID=174633 RepID=UPI0002DF450D|nr:tetratricopeptide repeat protein [Candidatus Kuenenia stuttgartiensis]